MTTTSATTVRFLSLGVALAAAACIPPGSYTPWGNGGGGSSGGDASGGPPADTQPPSPQLAATGAASALERITSDDIAEGRPALSPDGRTLLVTTWAPEVVDGQETGNVGEESIVGMRPDGRGRVIYTSTRSLAYGAAWLGSRASFVYMSNALGAWNLVRAVKLAPQAATALVLRGDNAPEMDGLSGSPDGTMVAFHTRMRDVWTIGTVKSDGSDFTLVTEGNFPRFSPDGRHLAFHRYVNDVWRIFTIDVEGGDLVQVTTGDDDCESASWSPDGQWLAMVCNAGWGRFADATRESAYNVFVVRPDGSDLTQVTEGARIVREASFGSDGWIYFSSNDAGGFDIWRVQPRPEVLATSAAAM